MVVAEVLAKHRAELCGNVKFIFQPAEERIGGALPMIEQGVLADPPVDAIVAFHLWNYLPSGKISLRAGPTFASADELAITIKGRMAHGALPHQGVDSIVVAAQVINALQTLVSREIDPLKAAVVTIGTIQGGNAFNIIAPETQLRGTIRAFETEVRDRLVARIEELTAGICAAMRADLLFRTELGCPPCLNDDEMTALVRRSAADVLGVDNVVTIEPSTGSDDMAYFLRAVPGCYFMVGSGNRAEGLDQPHHTPNFDFDEHALSVAVKVLVDTVFAYL